MEDALFKEFDEAKKNKDINKMRGLYEKNPYNYQIKLHYAKMLYWANETEKSREILLTFLDEDNKYKYKNSIFFLLGKIEIRKSNYELAREYLKKAIEIYPNDQYSIFALAKLEKKFGNKEEAYELFNVVLDINPKNQRALFELGVLELDMGNVEYAQTYLSSVLDINSNDIPTIFILATIEKKKNNIDAAKKMFEKILTIKGNDESALYELAMIEKNNNNIEKSREYLNIIEENACREKQIPALFELAMLEKKEGNIERSKQVLKKLFSIDSKDPSCLYELAMLEKQTGNDIVAQHYLDDLSRVNTQTAVATYEMAKLEKKLGNIEKAKELLYKAMDLRENYISAMHTLAIIEMDEGNYIFARYLLENILSIDENHVAALFALSKIEHIEGNLEEEECLFKKILNKKPEHAPALFEFGLNQRELGKLDNALESLKQSEKLGTVDDFLYLSIAKIYMELHNVEQAKKYMYKSLELKPLEHNKILLVIMELFNGGVDKAIYILNEILNNHKSDKVYDTILSNLVIYIGKEYNVFFDIDYSKLTYFYSVNQLLDYDEESSILDTIEYELEETREDKFNPKVNIYELFNSVKSRLTKENKLGKLTFSDKYILKEENIGDNGQNYLCVVTLPNTKDIITMYPINDKYGTVRHIEQREESKQKTYQKK